MNRLLGSVVVTGLTPGVSALLTWIGRTLQFEIAVALVLLQRTRTKTDIYNILWVLVFGFATLNILNLGTRHFEPGKNRLSFGEIIAILVVFVAIFLLGWEMLYLFKVFPLKLR
jgi:hypothetical protein